MISSYFIGISAGQLLYGPLLDRFEEKPLFIGLLVYILASLGCAFVSDIDTLLVCVLQSGRQLCRYGSCYRNGSRFVSRKEIPKVLSLLMLVVGLSPMLAPIGGYVTAAYGWHVVFLILMGIGIVVLLASHFGLPHTLNQILRFR
jgi:DHA1 family bicyclomycin/chloramphenicol resistance-like MFS transporter